MEGNRRASQGEGIRFIKWEDDREIFEIKSGKYSFTSKGVKKWATESYTPVPVISPKDTLLTVGSKLKVTINCTDTAAKIRYTIDGSEINNSSPVYNKPLEITDNTLVKAQAFMAGSHPGNQSKVIYNYVNPAKNGILWYCFKGAFTKVPDLDRLNPVARGKIFQFGLKKIVTPKKDFALRFKSFIQIGKAGRYTFFITSNDGSKLYIDEQLIVDNDGEHGAKEMSNSINIEKGKHQIRVDYFQSGGGTALLVAYSSDEIKYQPIPETILFSN